jgi:uncharacterized protein (DUF2252 family)
MPLEHVLPDAVLPVAARRDAGRAVRKLVPRSLQAVWKPPYDRTDPVQTLIDSDRHRVSQLLPIRYGRMRGSPFAFMRGAAAIMAADLAATTASGLWAQSCGDCHLANFGTFASAEAVPVFDITDFDETLPAPFEWDLKRLAASFAVNAISHGEADKTARHLARTVVLSYRAHMAELVKMEPLTAWRLRIDAAQLMQGIPDERLREQEVKRLHQAAEMVHRGFPRLLERRRGGWRIRARPPLLTPLCEQADDTHELAARAAFDSYRYRLPEERRMLLDRYKLIDLAFKVVGIGSVGTFCAIALLATANDSLLLLQLKEARRSVLAPYAGPGLYENQGQRVVVGQRIMQVTPDIFLGWTADHGDDQHCYVRQLKDSRLATVGSEIAMQALPYYATLCGATLARAHARSGDAARIAGYMGSGSVFDAAIADFAVAYAGQVERDWRLFLEAIKAGVIEARAE